MQASDKSPGVPPVDQNGAALVDRTGARPPARRLVWTVARATATVAVLVALYYMLPPPAYSDRVAITILVLGLAGFIAMVAFQARSISRSRFPALRVIEALATSVPSFLLLFAAAYVVLAAMSFHNFGTRMSHTDGLYFSVTVFATAGFGDISARRAGARLVVTGQMITDIVVLGVSIKILLGTVRRRQPDRTS